MTDKLMEQQIVISIESNTLNDMDENKEKNGYDGIKHVDTVFETAMSLKEAFMKMNYKYMNQQIGDHHILDFYGLFIYFFLSGVKYKLNYIHSFLYYRYYFHIILIIIAFIH